MRLDGNNITNLDKTFPGWLYFDKASRIFRGRVPEEEENINYKITIKFSSGINQINDKFLFSIYKNQGICAIELVGSIDTNGKAHGVSTMKIGLKNMH